MILELGPQPQLDQGFAPQAALSDTIKPAGHVRTMLANRFVIVRAAKSSCRAFPSKAFNNW
jgi:hypothetical protein